MKPIHTLTLLMLATSMAYSQSSIVSEVGTDIEVGSGADICADTIIIGGTFSGSGTHCGQVPLPIQLASFTALSNANGNGVLLNWTTISETNNYGFEIQRSPDNENAYNTLPNSFIPGHGTTLEPHYYSYVDATAVPALWYYRLRQIDLDGTVYYSEGITINTLTGVSGSQLPDEFALSENYPDPFNPSTTIRYQLPEAAQVTLKIYNILGQEVAILTEGVQEPGYRSVVWNVPQGGIASGVYFYRIVATSARTTYTATRKMVVIK